VFGLGSDWFNEENERGGKSKEEERRRSRF
jgi:hypothetical protein